MIDHYRILNVSRGASLDDIKRAYREGAKQYHPDKNKSSRAGEMFMGIKVAYEVLSDPEKRRQYDLALQLQEWIPQAGERDECREAGERGHWAYASRRAGDPSTRPGKRPTHPENPPPTPPSGATDRPFDLFALMALAIIMILSPRFITTNPVDFSLLASLTLILYAHRKRKVLLWFFRLKHVFFLTSLISSIFFGYGVWLLAINAYRFTPRLALGCAFILGGFFYGNAARMYADLRKKTKI